MKFRAVCFGSILLTACCDRTASQDEFIAQNEGYAISGLRKLCYAQMELKSKANHTWTGDIAGLQKLGLIPQELAGSDSNPISSVAEPKPHHGYFFQMMDWDDSSSVPEEFRRDSDETGRRVFNPSKAAFCAYPVEYGKTGRWTYIAGNEVGAFVIYGRADIKGSKVLRWPNHATIRKAWVVVE